MRIPHDNSLSADREVPRQLEFTKHHGDRLARTPDDVGQFLVRQANVDQGAPFRRASVLIDEIEQQVNQPISIGSKQQTSQPPFDPPPSPTDELGDSQREGGIFGEQRLDLLLRDQRHCRGEHRLGVILIALRLHEGEFTKHLTRLDEGVDGLLAIGGVAAQANSTAEQHEHRLGFIRREVDAGILGKRSHPRTRLQPAQLRGGQQFK